MKGGSASAILLPQLPKPDSNQDNLVHLVAYLKGSHYPILAGAHSLKSLGPVGVARNPRAAQQVSKQYAGVCIMGIRIGENLVDKYFIFSRINGHPLW
jgi:hypothetical protein